MNFNIRLWLIFSFLLIAQLQSAVNISISDEDKAPGEPFEVTFSCDFAINSPPDFTPLQENFEIITSSQRQNVIFMNGTLQQNIDFVLTIAAKKTGELEIPEIAFGTESSPSKKIEVSAQRTKTEKNKNIFITSEIASEGPFYQQAPIKFLVKIFRAVNLSQGNLSEPTCSDADVIVKKAESEREYEYIDASNQRFIVFERTYYLFPQRAGRLEINPVEFSGQIVTGNHFFNMNSKFFRDRSEAHELEISKIPAPFSAKDWLIAEDLTVTDEWSQEPTEAVVGEPITRTIRLSAKNANMANKLTLPFKSTDKYKVYAENPSETVIAKPEGLQIVKEYKFAVSPIKAGEVEIPSLKIKWWSSADDKIKTAQVNEVKLVAQEAPYQSGNEIALADNISPQITQPENNPVSQTPMWVIASLLVNGACFLLAFYYVWQKFNFNKIKPSAKTPTEYDLKSIKKACQSGDAKQAEKLLSSWAQQKFSEEKPIGISTVLAKLPPQLQAEINHLYRCLYGDEANWQGEQLYQELKKCKDLNNNKCVVDKRLEGISSFYLKK